MESTGAVDAVVVVTIWSVLRRSARAIPRVDPVPMQSSDDTFETGVLAGRTGGLWTGVMIKDLKDRRVATDDETAAPTVHRPARPTVFGVGSPQALAATATRTDAVSHHNVIVPAATTLPNGL
jgi:hypothetical protein